MSFVMQGAEPFFHPGDRTGCLLIHGLTASPQEMRGLGLHLADQGYSVLGIRLFGHGTHERDLGRARWRDWLANAEDGYHMLSGTCREIFLLGFSTGGALCFLLAKNFPTTGIISMSTPFQLPADPRLRILRPFLKPLSVLVPAVPKGQSRWWDPEAQKERVAYGVYPLRAVIELDALLRAFRSALPAIATPALLMHSKNDGFIPAQHLDLISRNLGATQKETILVERSNHIITCDAERDTVFRAASDFIRGMRGKSG